MAQQLKIRSAFLEDPSLVLSICWLAHDYLSLQLHGTGHCLLAFMGTACMHVHVLTHYLRVTFGVRKCHDQKQSGEEWVYFPC